MPVLAEPQTNAAARRFLQTQVVCAVVGLLLFGLLLLFIWMRWDYAMGQSVGKHQRHQKDMLCAALMAAEGKQHSGCCREADGLPPSELLALVQTDSAGKSAQTMNEGALLDSMQPAFPDDAIPRRVRPEHIQREWAGRIDRRSNDDIALEAFVQAATSQELQQDAMAEDAVVTRRSDPVRDAARKLRGLSYGRTNMTHVPSVASKIDASRNFSQEYKRIASAEEAAVVLESLGLS